jgi:hypothetical protein
MDRVPMMAKALGYGGLIPFLALTVGIILAPPAAAFWFGWAQTGYAVAIFSFIGAIHWGVVLARPELHDELRHQVLIWGVTPSLLAVAAMMLPHPWALIALAGLGALVLLVDVVLDRRIQMPQGWIRLRVHLTLVACSALLISALFLPSAY